MYADDTVIIAADKSTITLNEPTNTILKRPKTYCYSNELALNENKTVQINFTTRNRNVPPTLPGLQIVNSTKYLVATLDSKFTWH